MERRRISSLQALLYLAGLANASQWTVTSYYVARETTEIYTDDYYSTPDVYTYTYTDLVPLKPDVTVASEAAISTYTYDYGSDELEIIEIYLDPAQVDEEDLQTTTSYVDSYDQLYTYYVQPIVMTAPESCSSQFTFSTYTQVYIPSEVVDQYSDLSLSTSVYSDFDGDLYTDVTAFLPTGAVSLTVPITDNYYYTYYVADCINPTAGYEDYTDGLPTSTSGGGSGDDIFGANSTGGRFGIEECSSLSRCGWLSTALFVIAGILPAIFLLGFVESYFWFRRLMTGKSAFRFGTICWMFLLLPVICLTRRAPARDADSQARLREQWKGVSFGKAIGLWFKYGFRHRYPVELLGDHPSYVNGLPETAGGPQMSQPIGYGPPPPADARASLAPQVFYMPTESGNATREGGPTQVAGMAPHQGRASYYPQHPQPTYAAPHSESPQPATNLSSPSPVSQTVATSSAPRADVSPPQDSVSPVHQTGESSGTQPPHTQAGPSGT